MTTPPQFPPRQTPTRPSAAGARRVGSSAAEPPATRPIELHAQRAKTPVRPAPLQPAQPLAPQRETSAPYLETPGETSRGSAPRTGLLRLRATRAGVLVLVAALLAWPIGLLVWANGKVAHVEALSGAAGTPGTTYLLVGSDSRADGAVTDGAAGERSDTILVLHRAPNGRTAMISLPRDTYVQIAGYGGTKLNASFSFGGAPLLVETVESLTGLTVDHYVEIGMGGVVTVVDAVGGVNLCLDYDVNDELSQLVWTAGCHDVDGTTALAFARMRYSDPLGDIGRQARQRQVISAVVSQVATPGTVLNPFRQVSLIDAGTGALATDESTGVVDLGRLALAFRAATGPDGVTGNPPIADLDYHPGGVGSTVLLDEAGTPDFFRRLRSGDLTQEDMQ